MWTAESPLKFRDLHLAFGFDKLVLGVRADMSPVTDADTKDSLRATAGSGNESRSSDGASGARPDMHSP